MGLDQLYGIVTAPFLKQCLINSCMKQQFLLSKARNLLTGQTVKIQDLTGMKYSLAQRALCQEKADQLAASLSARTGETWVGYCESYVPTARK
jgi:hypothetical protein